MIDLLSGVSWPVFLGLTVVLFGGCAFMTGQSVATAWKPVWLVLLYAALLGTGDRFLTWGLFQGALWSLPGYLGHTALLMAIGVTAHRLTLARRVCAQYPWLYARSGPFGWRER